jgi:ParB/RepB/Spo0J family partition protein
MKVESINIAELHFATNRTFGGEGDVKILAEDIRLNGLINPITVMPIVNSKMMQVIAGRRRIQAVKLLEWETIPCRILEGKEAERAEEIAGAENINRLGMHPLDEAVIFKRLIDNGELIGDMAKRFDRKESAIWQRIQLLDLDEGIKTLFRNGNLTLHAAAMLRSLNEKEQKAFYKQYKDNGKVKRGEEIDDWNIKLFIRNLNHDNLYPFIKDKECDICKTRTYFGDKTLFPELDDVSDSCLKHDCYMKKFNQVLSNRIKNQKSTNKTHTEAAILLVPNDNMIKILGDKYTIDGVTYKVLGFSYMTQANSKDKEAKPCFNLTISSSGKLEIKCEYWGKSSIYSTSNTKSPTEQRKEFAPIVKLLELPKMETEAALDAINSRSRLKARNFADNVRESVFWRIMEIKAEEFKSMKNDSVCKELFLEKHFKYINGNEKKIFDMFAGKTSISELAKLSSDKVFALLVALEWNSYELPNPEKLTKDNSHNILKWAGMSQEEIKKLYQEEIIKRIPKSKPVEKKPVEKKSAKTKPSTAKKPIGKMLDKAVKAKANKKQ